MTTRRCDRCRATLPRGAVFFEMKTTIRGEQDLAELAECDDLESPRSLLARLSEEGDWQRYDDEVHWERGATLCPGCRRVVLTSLEELLTPKPEPTDPT